MSHYFTKNNHLDSNEKDIYFKIDERTFHFITDNGVFSKSGLDFGSRLLLESVIRIKSDKVLDLGSGYGAVGIVYKLMNMDAAVTMSDINDRAISLSKKNAALNKVEVNIIPSDGFNDIKDDFSMIISNPPIRAGKTLLFELLKESANHLENEGQLIFVIQKSLGALSALRFCEEIYTKVDIINKKSGYMVIRCIK
ncbi:MAG TPA: methyltransferase [Bacillota bacterium]|nr:methyltransferase [Bacillota bacterium]